MCLPLPDGLVDPALGDDVTGGEGLVVFDHLPIGQRKVDQQIEGSGHLGLLQRGQRGEVRAQEAAAFCRLAAHHLARDLHQLSVLLVPSSALFNLRFASTLNVAARGVPLADSSAWSGLLDSVSAQANQNCQSWSTGAATLQGQTATLTGKTS